MDGIPGQNWNPVLSEAGTEPIVIETMINGSPEMVSIGARVCVQMACASNAAIWWCNDVSRSSPMLSTLIILKFKHHNVFRLGSAFKSNKVLYRRMDGPSQLIESAWQMAQ
jgi:hypothetical protein